MIISDQLLHIRLREHHQRGAEKNLREDQEICYEIMSSIYEKKVVPMKSQWYGWTKHQETCHGGNLRVLSWQLRKRENWSFPAMSPQLVIQYQLVNPKNIYNISKIKWTWQVVFMYLFIYVSMYEYIWRKWGYEFESQKR